MKKLILFTASTLLLLACFACSSDEPDGGYVLRKGNVDAEVFAGLSSGKADLTLTRRSADVFYKYVKGKWYHMEVSGGGSSFPKEIVFTGGRCYVPMRAGEYYPSQFPSALEAYNYQHGTNYAVYLERDFFVDLDNRELSVLKDHDGLDKDEIPEKLVWDITSLSPDSLCVALEHHYSNSTSFCTDYLDIATYSVDYKAPVFDGKPYIAFSNVIEAYDWVIDGLEVMPDGSVVYYHPTYGKLTLWLKSLVRERDLIIQGFGGAY